MNRRGFLKSCVAGSGIVLMPAQGQSESLPPESYSQDGIDPSLDVFEHVNKIVTDLGWHYKRTAGVDFPFGFATFSIPGTYPSGYGLRRDPFLDRPPSSILSTRDWQRLLGAILFWDPFCPSVIAWCTSVSCENKPFGFVKFIGGHRKQLKAECFLIEGSSGAQPLSTIRRHCKIAMAADTTWFRNPSASMIDKTFAPHEREYGEGV
jgi:hypothetical protein